MCYKSNKEKAKQSIPQHEMNHMAKLAIDKKNSRFIDSIEISICDEFNRNKIAYNYRISDYKYKWLVNFPNLICQPIIKQLIIPSALIKHC